MAQHSEQFLRGPGGIVIILDSREVVPSDPGAGTPAMVEASGGTYVATYWCALDTGELDGGSYTLSDAQCRWLDAMEDTVNTFVESYS
jgi:hypothetical protein